jgi:hypothetical protein
MILMILSLGLGVALVAALWWMIRALAAGATRLPVTANWIEELSVERYRPMLRLLRADDFDFLRNQIGFTRKMEKHLRAERSRIFSNYLGDLSRDFNQVLGALKLVLIQSAQDRPDLATELVRQQLLFAVGIGRVRARLLLYRWGIASVDASALVGSFDTMRVELQRLIPASSDLRA